MSKWLPLIISLGLGVLFFILPWLTFLHKKDDRFSYGSHFIFESGTDLKSKSALWILAMLFVFVASFAYSSNLVLLYRPIFVTAMIMYIVSLLGLMASCFFNLEYYKAHLAGDLAFFLGEAGGDLAMFFAYLFKGDYIYPISSWGLIVLGVLGIILLASLFSPAIKRWAYMEKSEEN